MCRRSAGPIPVYTYRALWGPACSVEVASVGAVRRHRHRLRWRATFFSKMALVEPAKAGQLSLWWLFPAVPWIPGVTRNQSGGWWSSTHSSMRCTEVKVPGFNLGMW